MTGDRPAPTAAEFNAGAVRAMTAGDFHSARELLQQAVAMIPGNTGLWLNLAAACRGLSDYDGAFRAIEGALKTDPRSFMALLMKATLLEKQGKARQAAKTFGFAIALAPPEGVLDVATANVLQHARRVNADYVEEFSAFVAAKIGSVVEKGTSAGARRIGKFLDFTVRRAPAFRQEPSDYFYPGLPSIEFYDREEFPWLEALEQSTAVIREELRAVLRDDFRDFVPYVTYPDHVPLDQWKELNRSTRWGALHLLLAGAPVPKNCERCPRTVEAIGRLPQPRMPGRSPAAMFSALQPHTRIPPHTGVANTRLVMHLPLIVPAGCGFRVGGETREWREGEAWVFDDTIEHEAWNDSPDPRVILICDVWSPRISPAEQEAIVGIVAAMDQFHQTVPDAIL